MKNGTKVVVLAGGKVVGSGIVSTRKVRGLGKVVSVEDDGVTVAQQNEKGGWFYDGVDHPELSGEVEVVEDFGLPVFSVVAA